MSDASKSAGDGPLTNGAVNGVGAGGLDASMDVDDAPPNITSTPYPPKVEDLNHPLVCRKRPPCLLKSTNLCPAFISIPTE